MLCVGHSITDHVLEEHLQGSMREGCVRKLWQRAIHAPANKQGSSLTLSTPRVSS
jgi:hypothetical protein